MNPKSIAAATLVVLTAGGLASATMGGAARGETCDASDGECVLVPPTDAQAYHAAFPDFGGPEDYVERDRLEHFEDAAKRDVAWAYFSNNWFDGEIRFPTGAVELIDSEGTVPFIRLMARSGFRQGADPNFSMRSIARGDWDDQLTEWCEDAADTGIPLLAEFGTEVNGFWFPWNGRWNGAGGYSWRDNALYDGPESFQLAYRHIVDLCREAGANDITWFFHVDVGGWPQAEWNDAWNYYPGDDYVDWIGLSDYGPQKPGQPWESFHSRMDGFIYDLTGELGTDKPLAVLEYGAAAAPSRTQQARKARWISDAAKLVGEEHWPEIRALAYWHERWKNGNGSVSDLHMDSSPAVRSAYREALAGDEFSSIAEFDER
ncbi:MAG: glycoside hydrolase family 26 protein [Solirubrobacterales bacterium]